MMAGWLYSGPGPNDFPKPSYFLFLGPAGPPLPTAWPQGTIPPHLCQLLGFGPGVEWEGGWEVISAFVLRTHGHCPRQLFDEDTGWRQGQSPSSCDLCPQFTTCWGFLGGGASLM